jgi:hypothetical protein
MNGGIRDVYVNAYGCGLVSRSSSDPPKRCRSLWRSVTRYFVSCGIRVQDGVYICYGYDTGFKAVEAFVSMVVLQTAFEVRSIRSSC